MSCYGCDFLLNQIYFKYIWLIGQYIQKLLYSLEGKKTKTPLELVGEKKFYDLDPNEKIKIMTNSINQIHKEYGCKFNWKDKLIVEYKGKEFEIFKELKEIVINCIIGDEMDALDFSTSGIDFNKACKEASRYLVHEIIEKEKKLA